MTLKNELYCKLCVYDIVLFLLKIILLEKTYLLTKTNHISYNTNCISCCGDEFMSRVGIDKDTIIIRAAQLANEVGIENVTLKILADDLGVKSPSLYNHIGGLEDLKKQIMIYGWKQMEERMIRSAIGVSGYEAIKAGCYAFYHYAIENPGIFNAMLWYNKFQSKDNMEATAGLFPVLFKITASLDISEENCNHIIRTLCGFLEGFSLLVNNGAFGNPISIEESFEISVNVLIEGIKSLENK